MNISPHQRRVVEALTAAQATIDARLSQSLSGALGISYSEYRLLAALAASPKRQASRVDLASAVSMTPSGVTRALKPLEKIGMVDSVKHERDARLTLAALTKAGARTVANGDEIIADKLAATFTKAPLATAGIESLTAMLEELARS